MNADSDADAAGSAKTLPGLHRGELGSKESLCETSRLDMSDCCTHIGYGPYSHNANLKE